MSASSFNWAGVIFSEIIYLFSATFFCLGAFIEEKWVTN
jgi:hypothetical protein